MGSQVLVRGGSKNTVVDLGATAKAYVATNVIGVPTKIAGAVQDGGGTAILESLCVLDKENKKVAVDLYFFQQIPSSQAADGVAFALNATDLLNLLGKVSVLSTDYSASANVAEATKAGIGLHLAGATGAQKAFAGQGSKDVYVVAVARGSGTFVGTSSLQLRVGILQD